MESAEVKQRSAILAPNIVFKYSIILQKNFLSKLLNSAGNCVLHLKLRIRRVCFVVFGYSVCIVT